MKKLYKIYIIVISALFALVFYLSYQFHKNYIIIKRVASAISKTYEGVIPCADCSGIEIKIKIFGDNYEQTVEYLDKDHVFVENGKIKLDGDIIEIGEDYYRVEEDGLLKLDVNKHVITDSEYNYKLRLIK
ncbi:MAG: copper resistance protein NlpE [Rickettsiales bacterium]|jgi:copper homeostasis protein (lipoprotein)|nr:copper resistance protein NlpE [Rickettsiales bacterium]